VLNNKKILLVFNTVKYLKFKQIFYRVYYYFKQRLPFKFKKGSENFNVNHINFTLYLYNKKSYLGNNKFTFVNIEHLFKKNIDWNINIYGKLWTYNLNYFDYLLQNDITKDDGIKLIKNFIENKKIIDGLEPYPISLRGINWIIFISQHKINDDEINKTLFKHYQILQNNLEYHLLGNHLLENAFSLLFAALFFNNQNFLNKSIKILFTELNEQILEDGAHFELSPMYHQIILKKLLDAINLLQENSSLDTDDLYLFLRNKAKKMLSWLENITFRNGDIPMFNDSAYDIAPTSDDLIYYAKKLNINWKLIKTAIINYKLFRFNKFEIAIDMAQIGASYQPGHAHADTFTFVLYYENQPVIVDPAVSTYNIGKIRNRERSTFYHNTVCINKQNSSEIWGGFRVGKRAKVTILNQSKNKISGLHNGYKKIKHIRKFYLKEEQIEIIDIINKKEIQAQACLHIHPDRNIIFNKKEKTIIIENVQIKFEHFNNIKIENYYFAKGFNNLILSKKIVISFNNTLTTKINFLP